MSANTGRAPAFTIALAVDTKVKLGTMTSSPGPSPATRTAISSAAVHEFRINTRAHAGRLANQTLELAPSCTVARHMCAGQDVEHGLLFARVEPRFVERETIRADGNATVNGQQHLTRSSRSLPCVLWSTRRGGSLRRTKIEQPIAKAQADVARRKRSGPEAAPLDVPKNAARLCIHEVGPGAFERLVGQRTIGRIQHRPRSRCGSPRSPSKPWRWPSPVRHGCGSRTSLRARAARSRPRRPSTRTDSPTPLRGSGNRQASETHPFETSPKPDQGGTVRSRDTRVRRPAEV